MYRDISVPDWVRYIFLAFVILTISGSFIGLRRWKGLGKLVSGIAVLASAIFPFLHISYTLPYTLYGDGEFAAVFDGMKKGDVMPYIIVALFGLMVYWWIHLIIRITTKNNKQGHYEEG